MARFGLNVVLTDDRGHRVKRRTTWLEEWQLFKAIWWNTPLRWEVKKHGGRGFEICLLIWCVLMIFRVTGRFGIGVRAAIWITLLIAAWLAVTYPWLRLTAIFRARQSLWQSRYPQAIQEGWCPVCDYTLTALPPEHDGCVVCPECGAAWRLPVSASQAETHVVVHSRSC